MRGEATLVVSGDLRLSANQVCWEAQKGLEELVVAAFNKEGWKLTRGHKYDSEKKHGFIDSQAYGMEVFRHIDRNKPLVVAEAVWQYTNHILAGLTKHRGKILTLTNWSGRWCGLVGMLNLNASLTKAGIPYSTIWSKKFDDEFFLKGLRQWLNEGEIIHDTDHVRAFSNTGAEAKKYRDDINLGRRLGQELKNNQAIMGIFDEGCMGMFNAIIPDHLLHPTGIFKERLSQSALFAEMQKVSDDTAWAHRHWLEEREMKFITGPDEERCLTDRQILEGLKMYNAAVRIADRFGCAAIGIQYQLGLKDTCVASDLAEGLLNNPDRPPVKDEKGRILYEGLALPHFNEVDECAGLDAIMTNRVWTKKKMDPSTTLHDVRWGEHYEGNGVNEFVWLLQISGAAPASHYIGGYAGATSERQPSMYFPLGGGTLKGISKPGEIVWSRIYIEDNKLHMDLGRGGVVKLPDKETERRWNATTPQWPIMHAITYGVSREQFMAKHKANHIQVAYVDNA